MSPRRSISPAVLAVCATCALFLGGLPLIASADPSPSASAPGAPPPSASASAAPAQKGFWNGDPPEDAETPVPSEAEWSDAKTVGPISGIHSSCKGLHVREYIRIHCASVGHSIEQILGKPDGFRALIEPPRANPKGGWIEPPHWFQFALRKGDRKLFEHRLKGLGNYDSEWGPLGSGFWSAVWLEGEEPLLSHLP